MGKTGMTKFCIWIIIIGDIAAAICGILAGKRKQHKLVSPVWVTAIVAFVIARFALVILGCYAGFDRTTSDEFCEQCICSYAGFAWVAWGFAIGGGVVVVSARRGNLFFIIFGGVVLVIGAFFAWLYYYRSSRSSSSSASGGIQMTTA